MFIKYLKVFFIFSTLTWMLIIMFNYLIDPFSLYGSSSFKGVNAKKPEMHKHLRMVKAAKISQIKPLSLILGTSRAEYGIDPGHPGWKEFPVYNAAMSSANIYEMFRYLQHAYGYKKLKKVVLLVDFISFSVKNHNTDFNETRLSLNIDGQSQLPVFSDILSPLASLDAVKSSFKTIFNQGSYSDTLYLPNGMRDTKYDWDNILRRGGVRKAFLSSEEYYCDKNYNDFSFYSTTANSWDSYEKLLTFAYEKEIDLEIVISPSHARQYEVMSNKGLWQKFNDWKKGLVSVNSKVSELKGSSLFNIWDFSGYSVYNTLPIPSLEESEHPFKWYWESSHYKKELGDLVLNKVLNLDQLSLVNPNIFGVKITMENIDIHIDQTRKDKAKWESDFQTYVMEIEKICGNSKKVGGY